MALAWTKWEDRHLKRNCRTTPVEVFAKRLTRTVAAVRIRISKLGLRQTRTSAHLTKQHAEIAEAAKRRKNRYWSAQDLRFLVNHYCNTPTHEIARQLERTEYAVFLKANRLGLRYMKSETKRSWTENEQERLKLEYPVKSWSELSRIFQRSDRAIQGKAARMRLVRTCPHPQHEQWSKRQDSYLRKYYPALPVKVIAKRLNKRESVVARRAWQLKLRSLPRQEKVSTLYYRDGRAKFSKDQYGCWLWTGSLTKTGYGRTGNHSKQSRIAHRQVYIDHHCPIPEGYEIDHKCGIPRCVNPEHLEAVTHLENCRRSAEREKLKKQKKAWRFQPSIE